MIRIRQHGDNGELFDIKQFLQDIDKFFSIDSWFISIDWCQGDCSKEVEEKTKNGSSFYDMEFRKFYSGIYQTIDGSFEAKENDTVVTKLTAVDSSYWEISSKDNSFEKYMLTKYGKYQLKFKEV